MDDTKKVCNPTMSLVIFFMIYERSLTYCHGDLFEPFHCSVPLFCCLAIEEVNFIFVTPLIQPGYFFEARK